MAKIKLKRAYEPHEKDDGFRVLVDRLWPRGKTKDEMHVDLWVKDLAPSPSLRKWFGHESAKWSTFKSKYKAELKDKPQDLQDLAQAIVEHKTATLLFGAKDETHNNAVVLKEVLEKILA